MMGHGSSVMLLKDGRETDENGIGTERILQSIATTNETTSPVDISTKWGVLLAYELFNQIQNMMSIFVFDARPLQSFEAIRIQKSLFMPEITTDHTFEELRARACDFLKNRNSRTNKLGIVLITSDDTHTNQLKELISSSIELANGTIALDLDGSATLEKGFLCICNILTSVETEKFFHRYALCSLFMEDSSFPQAKKISYSCYPNEIVENYLFLGDQTHGREARSTQSLGFTHIIDVTNKQSSKQHCKEYNINYLAINIADNEEENIEEYFEAVRSFLQSPPNVDRTSTVDAEPKKVKVLIHCWAGISRSTTLVLACLMSGDTRLTLKQAVEHVASQRPMIHPNDGFMQKLIALELSLFHENTITTNDEFLEVIKRKARYWSQAATLENDFDRVPIDAWKNRIVDSIPMAEEGTERAKKDKESKEKKEFLKRGQGKTIAKAKGNLESIENTNSNILTKKDESNVDKPWLKKKNGIVRSNSNKVCVKANCVEATEPPAIAPTAVNGSDE